MFQEDSNCTRCGSPVRGTYIPTFGQVTFININRTPFVPHLPNRIPRKITTRLSEFPTQIQHDIGDLCAVINHRGTLENGHWIAYTKVRNQWYLHDDGHPMTISFVHPFNSLDPSETSNLLMYSKR